jgi:hypothetical protein
LYGYVKGNPIARFDPLGLVTRAECYAYYDQCKRNAKDTFDAYVQGLGIVGAAGVIVTSAAVTTCLASAAANIYVVAAISCAATIGIGIIDMLILMDAERFVDRDISICESMKERCLERACD